MIISQLATTSPKIKGSIKVEEVALAGVAQWIECQPAKPGVAGLIPSQGTCLGHRPGSPVRGVQEATTQ